MKFKSRLYLKDNIPNYINDIETYCYTDLITFSGYEYNSIKNLLIIYDDCSYETIEISNLPLYFYLYNTSNGNVTQINIENENIDGITLNNNEAGILAVKWSNLNETYEDISILVGVYNNETFYVYLLLYFSESLSINYWIKIYESTSFSINSKSIISFLPIFYISPNQNIPLRYYIHIEHENPIFIDDYNTIIPVNNVETYDSFFDMSYFPIEKKWYLVGYNPITMEKIKLDPDLGNIDRIGSPILKDFTNFLGIYDQTYYFRENNGIILYNNYNDDIIQTINTGINARIVMIARHESNQIFTYFRNQPYIYIQNYGLIEIPYTFENKKINAGYTIYDHDITGYKILKRGEGFV